jgi:mannosyltransferase
MKMHDMSKRTALLLLFLLLVLGSVLRFADIGTESLWVDEAYSLSFAQTDSLQELVEGIAISEGAPPGHYVLLYYWVQLFGDSEFALRMPSVLAGIASIVLIYLIGSVLLGRTAGILAAFLLTTSMLQVLYSQEARLYSIFGLFVLLAGYFFVKFLAGERRIWVYLGYGISMLLAIYTNYLAGSLLVFFFLLALWHKEKVPIKTWLIVQLPVILLSLPLLPLVLNQYSSGMSSLGNALVRKGVPAIFAQLGVAFFALPLLFLLTLCLIVVLNKKHLEKVAEKIRIPDSLFFSFLFFGVAVYAYFTTHTLTFFGMPLVKVPLTHSYFLVRHSYFLVPLAYLVLTWRILKSKRTIMIFSVMLLLVLNIFALSVYYQTTTKAEWQEATEYISLQEDAAVILLDKGGFSGTFLLDYYLDGYQYIRLTTQEAGGVIVSVDEKVLLRELENHKTFWLVLARNTNDFSYYEELFSDYTLLESKQFVGIEVYWYG